MEKLREKTRLENIRKQEFDDNEKYNSIADHIVKKVNSEFDAGIK